MYGGTKISGNIVFISNYTRSAHTFTILTKFTHMTLKVIHLEMAINNNKNKNGCLS